MANRSTGMKISLALARLVDSFMLLEGGGESRVASGIVVAGGRESSSAYQV
jgi:hypothetical protein